MKTQDEMGCLCSVRGRTRYKTEISPTKTTTNARTILLSDSCVNETDQHCHRTERADLFTEFKQYRIIIIIIIIITERQLKCIVFCFSKQKSSLKNKLILLCFLS